MNRSLQEVNGDAIVVSQFTLCADCQQGRRPSFTQSAPPDRGFELYNLFVEELEKTGLYVATGQFGAKMEVDLVNDGPVTFVIDR